VTTITIRRPETAISYFEELWCELIGEPRVKCRLGQRQITFCYITAQLTFADHVKFFDEPSGGNLLQTAFFQESLKLQRGDMLILEVHWENW